MLHRIPEKALSLHKRESKLVTMVEIDQILLAERNLNRNNCQPLLQRFGTLADAERVSVFKNQVDSDGTLRTSLIAEWCAETRMAQLGNPQLENVPFSERLEPLKQLLSSNTPLMRHAEELSPEESALFVAKGAQAVLLLPVFVKGEFYGIIGAEKHASAELWDDESLGFLKVTVASISMALERKYAEEELAEAKEQFQAVLDAMPGFVSWIDSNLTYLGLNQYLAATLGGSPKDYIGKKVGFMNPRFYNFLKQLFASPYQGNIMEDSVVIHGRRFHHLIVAQKYQQGKAAVCVGIDITDRKIMEEKLREQAALLDITHDAVILQDLEGRTLYWNDSARRMYGWTKEEVLGRNIKHELYAESDLERCDEINREILEKGSWMGELRQRTKDGKTIIVESRCTIVPNERGQADKILMVNTDITEKKNLESQMLRNQRMDSIGLLASGIAHDMNNVLAPILSSLVLIRAKSADEQIQRWIALLEQSAERGKELMKQILSFARGESGERAVLNLGKLAEEAYRFISQVFPKEIEIQLEVPSTLWMILGETTKIYQALLNLCVNARDAMPNGGRLTIKLENVEITAAQKSFHINAKEGEYVRLTVSDTGTGIPPEVLDKIFEPFFTTKEVGRGTGLGLSVVYSVMNSHGGFVDVETEVGKGTSFMLYFPATKSEQSEQMDEPLETMFGCGEGILLIEDELAVREVTAAILLSMGYNVLTAKNGAEAVALFAQHQHEIHLVLTDLMMPVMDGIACIHAIRSINPSIPVVAMTGLMNEEKAAKLSQLGIQGSINKPFRAEVLLKTIFQALKQTAVRTSSSS
jgi:two-component system cell cycle sensor histidine kinase/response regulator CckA